MQTESGVNINVVNLRIVNSIKDLFNLKSEQMKNSNLKLDNETKLKFYGLYKVATAGKYSDSNKKSLNIFDFVEKYKK